METLEGVEIISHSDLINENKHSKQICTLLITVISVERDVNGKIEKPIVDKRRRTHKQHASFITRCSEFASH